MLKILASGGGTGGHVYPALAILSSLEQVDEFEPSCLYVGHEAGMEASIVAKAGLRFKGISSGPLRGRRPWETAGNLVKMGVGLFQSLGVVSEYRPDVVLATGGYVCVPVVMAATFRGVPSLIYLPDVTPGMAVKFLSRFATRVAVTFDETTRFFPDGKAVVTGYPVRPEFGAVSREEGRAKLGLPLNDKVLLVFGGSRGAKSINDAVAESVYALAGMAHIVHVCGADRETVDALNAKRAQLPDNLAERYHMYPYLHEEMGHALAAADLVVSRAGASVFGEFPAFALPSILVPYPYAGAHQELNARCLVQAGAAVRMGNDEVRMGKLVGVVGELLGNEGRLAEMRQNAQRLARPEAARAIVDQLRDLAQLRQGGGNNASK